MGGSAAIVPFAGEVSAEHKVRPDFSSVNSRVLIAHLWACVVLCHFFFFQCTYFGSLYFYVSRICEHYHALEQYSDGKSV